MLITFLIAQFSGTGRLLYYERLEVERRLNVSALDPWL